MIEEILISKDRLSILIGKNGEIKKDIEEKTKTDITINDEVRISGEAINIMDAKNIITAIGRGFSPEIAMRLLEDDMNLCVISLPHDRKILIRIKSRIIGTGGKCRKTIEKLTNTSISVYGKTVSVIGLYEDVELTREAIEKLIMGSPHKNVYRFLETHCD